MSIEVAIVCDGCLAIMAAGATAERARRDIRESPHWRGAKVRQRGGRDLCPSCANRAWSDALKARAVGTPTPAAGALRGEEETT